MTNTFNRQALVEAYIDRVLDNMSTKDLLRIVGDQLEENISFYSDEELINVSIPDFLVIDWEATWKCNLQYDFAFVEGFIFNKNF